MTDSAQARRSATEWMVLDMLRRHHYDTRDRGGKPDDPGWHVCSCGWGGYWSDFHPHLAERIVKALGDWPAIERLERVFAARG